MEISGFLTAIGVGIVIGILGRLALPGRQRIGILWTLVVGIVAALAGTFVADAFDVAETPGVDWWELVIQVGLAAIGVGIVDRAKAGR
ncbi:GlsB/YeaQ/YmgE family stress response membrane protein [Streptomyces sp. NPDC051940]|uniref:GlsB/YeaQ/YmgE family stress response membrane protein n=1 Tax=Streptomyces sp. NPDC051940 TaxID=3155675 RepID=UPI0034461E80